MSAPLLRSARLLLLVAACAVPLAAFPGGAPTEACLRGMVPNHRGTRSSSLATMPFSVTRQTTADGVRGEGLRWRSQMPFSVTRQITADGVRGE